jgi:hypothetical protein
MPALARDRGHRFAAYPRCSADLLARGGGGVGKTAVLR